jgi:hypothetical protein
MEINKLIIEGVNDDENGSSTFGTAYIEDAEDYLIQISFLRDGCATIDTKKLEYLPLTKENLNSIKKLLKEAEEYFDSEEN